MLHGGSIGMDSEGRGKGSTFFISLPAFRKRVEETKESSVIEDDSLYEKSTDTAENRIKIMNSSSKSFSHKTSKVLPVIEDDESVQTLQIAPSSEHKLQMDSNSTNEADAKYEPYEKVRLQPLANPSLDFVGEDLSSYKRISGKSFHHLPRALRFLIVDDSSANRKMLGRLLKRDGHIVHEAEDGKVAVSMIQNCLNQTTSDTEASSSSMSTTESLTVIIDVILMDNFMTQMNGPEATKIIRTLGFKGPIIGVTGSLSDDIEIFIKHGADLILQKPIDIKSIWAALASLRFFK